MSEPTPIGSHMARWRRPVEAGPPELDDDDAVYAAEIAHSCAARRWHGSVPQRFHHADLRDFADRPWRDQVAEWAFAPQGRNVVVRGPVGVGKTHLACALVRQASFEGLELMVVDTPTMFDLLRPDHGEPDYIDNLCEVSRLVVDDVGTEKQSEWTVERFDLVVNRRWAACQPTVFTTNLDSHALASWVGERAFSRMTRGALKLVLSGEDRRET